MHFLEHLKDRLLVYLKQFNGKVKLIRNTEREGLIRTRSIGAKKAVGDVVIFLDAHCEVNINWLPPLLAPIRHNRFAAIAVITVHRFQIILSLGKQDNEFADET